MKKSILTLAAVAALTSLAGCSLAPVYQQPAAPVAQAWPAGAAYANAGAQADAKPVSEIAWQDYFADERLRKVIALALANNRDLRVSALNIDKARAQYGIDSAAQLPKISAAVSQSASRTPANSSADGEARINRSYNGGLALASYELDFFGKVRNLSEAGLQSYLGTEEAQRAQQISLVAEVANAYLTLVADQQRLTLAADTLKNQQIAYELSQRRFTAGATSGLDRYEAQSSVEAARNDMAVYTAQVALDQNALTLLVGASVPQELQPQGQFEPVSRVAALPAGLPSAQLQQRPDVLEAERTLRAANANIGVARAAFFPSITLTGSGGSASGSLAGLFRAGSSAWSFLPQISLPIFDGGANRANLTIAKADKEIAVARYEKAIQSAFREVADALAQHGTLEERLASQQALVEVSGKSYGIHQARYKQGSESYLNVLVSQRALYAAQQSLISARLLQSSNAVTLYKVLGGGASDKG
ncbi:efflux transporter outer membrane subunit [Oxalobacteraceae bacterium]|nr:efflux transporter outer membrane subunit [Oxalobacteraceae bacterium]